MLTLKNNSSGTSAKKVSILVCRRRVVNPLPVFKSIDFLFKGFALAT